MVLSHPTLYPDRSLTCRSSQNGPSMAQKRGSHEVNDSLPDQNPIKKTRLNGVSRNQSRTLTTKSRADEPSHDRASPELKSGGVSPPHSRSQTRKRRAEDVLPKQVLPKKSKSTCTVLAPSNFPPEFYDNLSKIWLTPRALQELDRRNEVAGPSRKPRRLAKLTALAKLGVADLAISVSDLIHLQEVYRHGSIVMKSF